MEKLTAAAAKENFENMVKSVTEENKVYQIKSGRNSAVLISYKENVTHQINSIYLVGNDRELSNNH